MTRVYGWREFRLIASRIGPCHDRREMLECVERAAQDHLTDLDSPSAAPVVVRDQLRALADAARKAHQAFDGLDLGSDLHLAYVAVERGFKLHMDYLEDLADAAVAAADMPVVKRGEQPAAIDGFIVALAAIVEYFAGWRAASTHRRVFVDAPADTERPESIEHDESWYGGRFFDIVKACAEPLDIKKNDVAWDKAIRRALERDKLAI